MKKERKETVTYTELIAIAHEKYDGIIREFEAKKKGTPDDEVIDMYLAPFRKKCEILNFMFENETGKKLFEEE